MGGVDKAKDKAEQLKGRMKEKVGDVIDDESMENEGRVEEFKGKVKEEGHNLREEGEDNLHEAKERFVGEGGPNGDDEGR